MVKVSNYGKFNPERISVNPKFFHSYIIDLNRTWNIFKSSVSGIDIIGRRISHVLISVDNRKHLFSPMQLVLKNRNDSKIIFVF
jgi:hypothetical protein